MPEINKNFKVKENKSDVGVLIDIDGVIFRGNKPIEHSKESIHKLWNNKIPFAFLTNGTYTSDTITKKMSTLLDLPLNKGHSIVAPSPCLDLTEYHNKNVLVCCQEEAIDLIKELGFQSFITIPELSNLFPELDFVDHMRRIHLNENPPTAELKELQEKFKPIEAILLLGEPINWECQLQLLLDILMLNGDPRSKFKGIPDKHLPIIACNKDLTFKGAAQLPRFGHGAFLECLEILYKKVTKSDLKYDVLMGKPCLVTYEFASMQLQKLALNGQEIKKFYIIGDNPDVDVRGANIFKEHLKNSADESTTNIEPVESILVSTGVYNAQNDIRAHLEKVSKMSHLTENEKNELKNGLSGDNTLVDYFKNKHSTPDLIVANLNQAVDHILKRIY